MPNLVLKVKTEGHLRTIFILRKDIGVVGRLVQKMAIFPLLNVLKLLLHNEWVVQKSPKNPLRDKEKVLYHDVLSCWFSKVYLQRTKIN